MLKAYNENDKPLAGRVAEQIGALISSNDIKRGEKLPNEFELAEALHVGRGTNREAVKLLVSGNVLEIRRGKGTYVSEQPGVPDDPYGLRFYEDKQKLMEDLNQIRYMIEPQIAALAAKNADAADIAEMKALSGEIDRLIEQGKPYIETDVALHTCWAKSTKN